MIVLDNVLLSNLPECSGNIINSNTSLNIPPGLITLSPLPVLGGIGIYVYSNRPKIIEKKETAHFINAEVDHRLYEYTFTIWWGWEWFPWHKMPRTGSINVIKVLPDTELEFYHIPRNNQEEYLPEPCIRKEHHDDKISISFTDRCFFIKESIDTVFLITRDKEKSDYKSKINLSFYPDNNNPSTIKITNKNKVMIKNFVYTFDESQTRNITNRHPDYQRYLRVHNHNISDCLIENCKLTIIINEIPKHSAGIDGIVTINLD